MSLDFYLRENDEIVFERNITHNLNRMADAAALYHVLWRPDENNITHAHQCIKPLSEGLLELVTNKDKYEQYNSPNGWGMYEHFVPFVSAVLSACCAHPEAEVYVSR